MYIKKAVFLFAMFLNFTTFAQVSSKKVNVSGIVLNKTTNLPLKYISVSFLKGNKIVADGITDVGGNFIVQVNSGNYNLKLKFDGFKELILNDLDFTSNTNLEKLFLEENEIESIVVRTEKSTIDLKLDKKIYNVGKDMIVKGGTLGDVLNNVPSVTVDAEGIVTLRGNESVTILIDGKPSGLAGVNVADALKILPADVVDKVEVITNPSARYDAEGAGGIVNIILRKGKVNGFNGSLVLSGGVPKTYGLNSSMNYKVKNINLFTNLGYNYRTNKGITKINSKYLNDDNSTIRYLNERKENKLLEKSFNLNFGFDWSLLPTLSWTNSLSVRDGSDNNPEFVSLEYFNANKVYEKKRNRNSEIYEDDKAIEYATNFTKKFKKQNHKLTFDFSTSFNRAFDETFIFDFIQSNLITLEKTSTGFLQKNRRNLFQTDYVLPIGEDSRFEVGYRGNFLNNFNGFTIIPTNIFSKDIEYIENINAFYMQFGSKIKKISYFLGLRYEDSHIEINALSENNFNTKNYNYLYPTATFNYEINDKSTLTLGYSRRINRPRGRFISPITTYTSNINIILGNPDLNPTNTDVIELGFMKKINKLTINSSAYVNFNNNIFTFARRESGLFVDNIPVILSSPINLAKEIRSGFEFNINYNPFKWWRLNTNFNTFNSSVRGKFTYENYLNQIVVQNFDNNAFSWFTRINSKVTLPKKIDFQTNLFYEGAQKTAQGKRLSISNLSLALSKDILKDNATITLNTNDLFNSNKRRIETFIDGSVESYSEYQRRRRTILLSFTYRFNKQKNDREKNQRSEDGGGGEF